jgi:hypothetical protein
VTLAGTLVLPAARPRAEPRLPSCSCTAPAPDEGDAYRVYATRFAEAGIAALVVDERESGASTAIGATGRWTT